MPSRLFTSLYFLCAFALVAGCFGWPASAARAGSHHIAVPDVWRTLLSSGRSLEISEDPIFEKIVFNIESDLQRSYADFDAFPSLELPPFEDNRVLFWRMRDRQSQLRIHSGVMVVVPAGSEGLWIDFGVDATSNSRWEVRATEIEAPLHNKAIVEKTFFFSGSSVLLKGQAKPWLYRIHPAMGDPSFKKVDGQFAGMRVARAALSDDNFWRPSSQLYPTRPVELPEFVGPLGGIIDAREPTRETVSSVRLLVKYLHEDLSIKRDLEFDVSAARSIGGAIKIEDVSFYPASIFADFEWHGVKANYEGAPVGQPPEIVKHVFAGLSVGYDLAKFLPSLEQYQVALHVGPQLSLVSVPVTGNFEPKGFVGLRLQPQVISLGAVWYGNFQTAKRTDGDLAQFAVGYMNCRFLGVCLSFEGYKRSMIIRSGADETLVKEAGMAFGAGANL